MITLRPYQETALHEIREHMRHHRDPLFVSPCGSGKGSLIAYMVDKAIQKNKRVIFAVHGKSLVVDMAQRVSKLGVPHGILMGGKKRERHHPVQVASIDTLHRMEHPPMADLIIVDESHMALSPTWRMALAKCRNASGNTRVVGMTATPIRLDKKGLGRKTGGLFDAIVMGPNEQALIDQGHLVGSRVLAPPPPPDLGNVKKTAGEFDARQQAQVCDKTTILGDIVKHWEQHAGGVKTAAFGIDKAHALHIAESFRAAGYDWAYVDADTPMGNPLAPEPGTRAYIWRDLDEGKLRGVSSVGCISVGWDHPVVACLIAARKTASLGLWKQMLGRGSRTHLGKTHFLVLDHVGNTHFHQPYGCFEDAVPWSLDGDAIKPGDAEKQERYMTCKTPTMVEGEIKYPCYGVFKVGPRECPYCGIKLVKKIATVEVEDGELQEYKPLSVDYSKMGVSGGDVRTDRMAAFRALLWTSRDRPRLIGSQAKIDWAKGIYRDRYGVDVPKDWVPREL